jgi:anhydro-N-acetylmuramic acid kinase
VNTVHAGHTNEDASQRASHSAILVGLMSGTSLDGISAAAVRFTDAEDGRIASTLLSFTHRAYAPHERERLEQGMREATAREFCRLHADLGEWLADAANDAINAAHLTPGDVAAIASHGQTLWHEPGHSTWQIGDAARIAERTGCAVIADFRARDVAVGGQGAPLVSMADARLFSHPTAWRALQNLGGIGNIAIVPPANSAHATEVLPVRAFDTGPGVVIIDGVTRRVRPGLTYDRDGLLARAGTAVAAVIDEMLEAPYFRQAPPKSTGREWFTRDYIDAFEARCREHHASDEDVVATATLFTARALAEQVMRFVDEPIEDLVLAGGGAKNPTLVSAIAAEMTRTATINGRRAPHVVRFDDLFFDGEAKEAVAFALMGYLHLTGRSGNVPSATGARTARVLGHYTPAQ